MEALTRLSRLVEEVRTVDKVVKVLEMCEELSVGAEARVLRCKFLGIDAVAKLRLPKPFLDPRIDAKLRVSRTRKEARAILKALELGVRAPVPLWIDEESGLLIMQFVEGRLLRDYVVEKGWCDDTCRYFEILGEFLGKMHSGGLVHGDPTTSNAIINPLGELYVIDFGLAEFSNALEDKAIDVHITFRAIESTHFVAEQEFKNCFLRGYSRTYDRWRDVVARVREIRTMGRYVERRRTVWGEDRE